MTSTAPSPIIAIATAPGRGGIGVVRISGQNLQAFARALLPVALTPRHAHYTVFPDQDGQAIDAGLALFFPGPHSYTGEDVLELQGHGGPAVLQRLLKHCLNVGSPWGLRLAAPGEFTQRAFLNNRLDLAQAEAVADLIDATSEAAARSAMASLRGAFSQQVRALAEDMVQLRMLVEATLDFPEEDIDFLQSEHASEKLAALSTQLRTLLRHAQQSMVLRDGLHVVLVGQPNVGKSSLLNALAGDEVAIVTPVAGTTRDRVIQTIHLDGVVLHVIDTAGLRATQDTVERIGIARTWAEIGKADVILHLQDARSPDDCLDTNITRQFPAHTPVLTVLNKCDLLDPAVIGTDANDQNTLTISAKTGTGLDALRARLLSIAGVVPGEQSPWLARQRHLYALTEAQQHLHAAAEHAAQSDPMLDIYAEELRLAHRALMTITGEVSSDDLLGEIFSRFCIGK